MERLWKKQKIRSGNMFVYTEYSYISGNHRKFEVDARNLEVV